MSTHVPWFQPFFSFFHYFESEKLGKDYIDEILFIFQVMRTSFAYKQSEWSIESAKKILHLQPKGVTRVGLSVHTKQVSRAL